MGGSACSYYSSCSDAGTGLCRQEDAATYAGCIRSDGGTDGRRGCRRIAGL